MVNVNRVKRKLPSLLCDGDTGKKDPLKKKNNNKFMRYRYQLIQLKKKKPERFNYLTNELLDILKQIEQEINLEKAGEKH